MVLDKSIYCNKIRDNYKIFNRLGFVSVCVCFYLFLSVLVVGGHNMDTKAFRQHFIERSNNDTHAIHAARMDGTSLRL